MGWDGKVHGAGQWQSHWHQKSGRKAFKSWAASKFAQFLKTYRADRFVHHKTAGYAPKADHGRNIGSYRDTFILHGYSGYKSLNSWHVNGGGSGSGGVRRAGYGGYAQNPRNGGSGSGSGGVQRSGYVQPSRGGGSGSGSGGVQKSGYGGYSQPSRSGGSGSGSGGVQKSSYGGYSHNSRSGGSGSGSGGKQVAYGYSQKQMKGGSS